MIETEIATNVKTKRIRLIEQVLRDGETNRRCLFTYQLNETWQEAVDRLRKYADQNGIPVNSDGQGQAV